MPTPPTPSSSLLLVLPSQSMCDINLVVLGHLGDNPCCRLGEELKNSALPSQGTIKVLDKATEVNVGSVPEVEGGEGEGSDKMFRPCSLGAHRKTTDAFTQIRVDISFNVKTTTECAELIEVTKELYLSVSHPPTIGVCLEAVSTSERLKEVWTGGISSYGLILMIVSFLQVTFLAITCSPRTNQLWLLLIEFFELYGVNFNYFKTGITVENGGSYFPKEDASFMTDRFSLLCLKDPLNNGVDLGRNSFGFMEVRKAFHYAYQVLTQAVVPHIDQESNGHSILGRIIRVTDEVMDHRLWVQQNWAGKQWLFLREIAKRQDLAKEVNKKSAMNPTAATNMSNSNDVINNKVTSISSSSSGEIVSSSSDSESEMSSQTSGSSKDTIDSVQGPLKGSCP
ncbi:putative non-canonical poly(A) RNA polymerase PAPD5 [Apostichopus japonicus]|uniref:Putative non-canonical poly(A) RNA polymerase PAPD5 n=1 Tax=Stichopus japonicus TaxID=307972 RepID=A0A2G8K5W0_STIJA|nr:putative non-canonical poly(A) RNA polymerase PAPD5 [Apostichopus japonicus]